MWNVVHYFMSASVNVHITQVQVGSSSNQSSDPLARVQLEFIPFVPFMLLSGPIATLFWHLICHWFNSIQVQYEFTSSCSNSKQV